MYNHYAAKVGNVWRLVLFANDVMQTWRGREKKIIENKTLGSRFLVGQGYFTVTRSLRLLKVYCAKSSINLIRFNLLDIRRHY